MADTSKKKKKKPQSEKIDKKNEQGTENKGSKQESKETKDKDAKLKPNENDKTKEKENLKPNENDDKKKKENEGEQDQKTKENEGQQEQKTSKSSKKKKKKGKDKDKDKDKEVQENKEQKAQDTSENEKSEKKDEKDLTTVLYSSEKRRDLKNLTKSHVFWDTQPVPKIDEKPSDHGPIEVKTLEEVRKEPYPLPNSFEWSSCDMNDPNTVEEVYALLSENYVEDDDNMFRFDYSRDFLQWALKPPGYRQDWHVGVRTTSKKKLVGFITGIPADMRVYGQNVKMVEINFLCVHKKLRSKRLAPVLIKEVTRRVNLQNIWQAVYTAGVVLPKPVAQNRYYHRSLNPKKLIDIGFSRLQPRMTLARTIKLYRLPNEPQTKGIRKLRREDVKAACLLLSNYLKKFSLVQSFTEEDFIHWFLPRPGVVDSYVVEDPTTHKITDFISFYMLPSTVIGNIQHKRLNAAYSFYNVSTKTQWPELINDSLILAKNAGFDVFNALDVMENEQFIKPLKFGIGDGHLQYYLYNWRCPEMKQSQVGLVLL